MKMIITSTGTRLINIRVVENGRYSIPYTVGLSTIVHTLSHIKTARYRMDEDGLLWDH